MDGFGVAARREQEGRHAGAGLVMSELAVHPEAEEKLTSPDESPGDSELPCEPGEGEEPGDQESDRSWDEPASPTSDLPGEEDYDGRD